MRRAAPGGARGFRRFLPVLGLLATVAALLAPPADAATSPPQVALGVYLPEVTEKPQRLQAFSRLVGRKPALVSIYKQWDSIPFLPSELAPIWNSGAVPMVTWEPFSYSGKKFPLREIQRGRFDQYIRESANAARRWGKPLLVRFAHEMNGDWYPWGRGVEGNNSYRYRAVWRRVVGIFRKHHAGNVQWVWTPNVNTGGNYPFQDLYPGDRWVDWVGFDGFNWAERGEWNSFTEIVDNTYEELAETTDKPMIVSETGSSEAGGDKAAWIASALNREIPRMPRIRALVWFDERFEEVGEHGGSLDARVNSSPESLAAFRKGIASPYYGLTRTQLLATPAAYGRGSETAPAPPSSDFGQPSLFYRYTHKLHGRYLVAAIVVGTAVLALLAALCAAIVRRRRRRARTAETG